MNKLSYLAAAAAISGLALTATPASAGPLASGLTTGNAAVPLMDEGLVQKVHGWHCRWRRGHRHRRACYDDDYHYGYGYPGYGFGFPFFAFSFFDDDDHHHWRGHRRHGKFGRHFKHRKFKRRGGHRKWKRKHW
jgi:hypothetical protein